MTTYNTYQEAKINNPDSEIYRLNDEFFTSAHKLKVSMFRCPEKCNPADYCMTVEKFLKLGHKFVDGDVVIGKDGHVITLAKSSVQHWSCASKLHGNRYILRSVALNQTETPEEKEAFDVMAQDNEAAGAKAVAEYSQLANENSPRGIISRISDRIHNIGCEHQDSELGDEMANFACELWELMPQLSNAEPKPKRTKTEFKRLTTEDVSVFDLKGDLNSGTLHSKKSTGEYTPYKSEIGMVRDFLEYGVYRKVETEITEREAFIEEALKAMKFNGDDMAKSDIGKMFDSGKFKLVDGE